MSAHLDPLTELPHAMLARDWDLHVERAGARADHATAAAGDRAEQLWVATAGRRDEVLEAQGRTPKAALDKLWAEVVVYCRTAASTGRARP